MLSSRVNHRDINEDDVWFQQAAAPRSGSRTPLAWGLIFYGINHDDLEQA
jgi:hypothetical protein